MLVSLFFTRETWIRLVESWAICIFYAGLHIVTRGLLSLMPCVTRHYFITIIELIVKATLDTYCAQMVRKIKEVSS